MGKQRTSRPQAFKATAAASSEMKAHVGEKSSGSAGLSKEGASDTRFADGELEQLLDNYMVNSVRLKTSRFIPISGNPSLKLPTSTT